MEAELEVSGLWTIMDYMRMHQAIIVEYSTGRINYKLFTGAENLEGSSRLLRWWYREHAPIQAKREVGQSRNIV